MHKLKYIFISIIVYLIFRYIYISSFENFTTPSRPKIINVAMTQPDGTIIMKPCISTGCIVNCNIISPPSGSCVLVSK